MKKSTTSYIPFIGSFINTAEWFKKFGMWNVLAALCMVAVIGAITTFIAFLINPEPLIKIYNEVTTSLEAKHHQELIDRRMTNTPYIEAYLHHLQADTDFDRAFVIEFHNGTNNLAALPFWGGDMTYEYTIPGTYGVRDNWTNISLTRYSFFSMLVKNNYWMGDVKEIENIDRDMHMKLRGDDVSYLALVLLYNTEGSPLGILGVTALADNAANKDRAALNKSLVKYAQIINPLLIGR